MLLKILFMKSKITIEIAHDNQPVILIDYQPSPDVRDTLVKRFLETFEGLSEYASFRFNEVPLDYNGSMARIRPIKPEDMESVSKNIMDVVSGRIASSMPMNGSNLKVTNLP
jgi:hypothetical protein